MVKKGILRPLIVPKYPEIGLDIIKGNLKSAKMTEDQLLSALNPKKKRSKK